MIYSILGIRADKKFFTQLQSEGIRYDSGRVWLTFTLRDFSGPGMLVSWKKRISRGQILLTEKRLVGIAGKYALMNIPLDMAGTLVKIGRSIPKRLRLQADSGAMNSAFSGEMILDYHVDPAKVPFP